VREFSGDYPGVWQRAVEASGIQQAAFFAGGVGSHSPRAPQGGFDGAKAMGETLASRTTTLLPQISLSPNVDFAASLAVISLPDLQVRLTDSIRLRPWVARNLMPPLSETTLLQAFRFGNRVWLSTPCDYSGELALQLKAAAREAGVQAVVTSFNGDYVGYVIPSKYYHLDGYEPRVMNFYGARISEVFADTLAKLAVPAKSR
jgi:neutral ceramidase